MTTLNSPGHWRLYIGGGHRRKKVGKHSSTPTSMLTNLLARYKFVDLHGGFSSNKKPNHVLVALLANNSTVGFETEKDNPSKNV